RPPGDFLGADSPCARKSRCDIPPGTTWHASIGTRVNAPVLRHSRAGTIPGTACVLRASLLDLCPWVYRSRGPDRGNSLHLHAEPPRAHSRAIHRMHSGSAVSVLRG